MIPRFFSFISSILLEEFLKILRWIKCDKWRSLHESIKRNLEK